MVLGLCLTKLSYVTKIVINIGVNVKEFILSSRIGVVPLDVCRKEVVSQVEDAPFTAVIADETNNVIVQNQLSIVVTYIHHYKVVLHQIYDGDSVMNGSI